MLPSKTAPHARDFCPGLAALLCYYGFFPAGILLKILLLLIVLFSCLFRSSYISFFFPERPSIR
jgi:hypothetical protein